MRIPGLKILQRSARWLRSRFTHGALILGYHRVADVAHDPHLMCVSPQHFAAQLEALRRFAHTVSLQELVLGLQNGALPRRAVALTFDDGYADVLYHAWPLLERYEIPATVFVVSGCLGREFWWDESARDKAGIASSSQQHGRALTADEVIQLARYNLVEIGSHSVTHPKLATRPVDEQRSEIQQSKAYLEELLGRPVTSFSYPHGSVSDGTRNIVRETGYRCACASFNDVVYRGSDPFRLPRFWVPDWDGDRFGRWLRWWLRQ